MDINSEEAINNNKNKPTKKFDFKTYKVEVVKDDIKKMRTNLKPRWYENIIIFGILAYIIRLNINLAGVDRGLLRKQIFIHHIYFALGMLFYFYILIYILTPWLSYGIYKLSIDKTEKLIYTDKN